MKKRILITGFFTIVFLIFVYHAFNPFVSSLTIEAGHSFTIKNILKKQVNHVKIESVNQPSQLTLGHHKIKVMYSIIPYWVDIHVVDTTPPQATIKDKQFWVGDSYEASSFVENIRDYSDVVCSFKEKKLPTQEGKYHLTIVLTDAAHNESEYQTMLQLIKDTQAPCIAMNNTIVSTQGENIQYKKNVTVTDNRDKNIQLTVDSSQVRYNKPGIYYATYKAIDQSGNQTHKKVKVIILSTDETKVRKEASQLTDEFIAQITKPKQSKQEKLKICFDYIRNHIQYDGQHAGDKDHYYIDALNGLKTWKGDCLVSNGILRVVCERLEIPTILVERQSKTRSRHYWFLADTGDGWYHYDAYNQYHRIYRWSDEELLSWSKKHDHYQDFDQSLYPATPKK